MSASSSLHATLGDLASVDARALGDELESRRRADEDALDPIGDPLAIADDRPIASIVEVAARLKNGASRVDLLGARGGALGHAVAAVQRALGRPIVLVTADVDRARTLVSDLEFFTSEPHARPAPLDKTTEKSSDKRRAASDEGADGEDVSAEDAEDLAVGDVLMIGAPEASPFAEVAPDRRAALARLATLSHLARAPFSVLVVPATALVRRVVPRATIEAHTEIVRAEEELDRDALLARLTESGYLRVPVVEDPGTFAVRGALLDVWAPSSPRPVRIELYGELVLSIKTFDPEGQRTIASVTSLHLPPAREAVLTRENVDRAKTKTTDRCEAVDLPTSKMRALVEDVAQGRSFFGAEGYLPAYYDQLDPLWRYVSRDALIAIDDPSAVVSAIREELARAARDESEKAGAPVFPASAHYLSEADVAAELTRAQLLIFHRMNVAVAAGGASDGAEDAGALQPLEGTPDDTPTLGGHDQSELATAIRQARSTRGRRGALDPLVRRLRVWREHGLRTMVTARATTQAERLVSLLRAHDVTTKARLNHFDARWLRDETFGRDVVEVCVGSLAEGAILHAERLAIVTEEEIFGARAKRRPTRAQTAKDAARPFIEDLRALSVGDLVVHAEHGIGRYLGLEHREILGPAIVDADGKLHQPKTKVDLIVVEYGGSDRLYLPVYRLNQIQKYSGGEGAADKARLDKLGGSTFAKAKSRVEKAVRQMADELLRLYAERQAVEGEPLPTRHEGDDYREFEATFPFEETVDQAKAIEDVLDDLEKSRPMDRLVCGDVGFGKTEVAIRAAFRAAITGKQVAVLCPTTVLAQQHFLTFSQRLAGYPITIAPMSRFQDDREQRETIKRLKEGKIDVVVGTHRLLSKDVHFKDLGLLVVDEEQRFGVTHKERIKQLKTKVHVLTLSATPIPRTLQMAVSGLRDLSLITTPPVDRRAIRTLVTRWDDAVVRDAVTRELQRGGQVFYVYNRVGADKSGAGGIYEKAGNVQRIVPSARVGVAHGQMGEKELEQAMLDFVEGRYDVLCSTAIVESGLDIPRANTIIVDRADLFGLSQLYQLRGRVGRSKERAYCYLIVPPQAAMSDEARMRIDALEKHTELGAGFKIASLDLELRGAGDLLGGEQSGNVAQVGFEMFCNMLDEAVQRLRSELSGGDIVIDHDIDPELSFDVEAFLPDDYVSEVGVRLGVYKRLASAPASDHGGEEIVSDIALEMEDRFGPPPEHAARFVRVMRCKTQLRSLKVLGCEAVQDRVTLHLRDDTPLDPDKLMKVVAKKGSPWRLTPDRRLTRRWEPGETRDGIDAVERLIGELQAFRKDES